MKKNIIFGIGRVQKDFEYIFDQLVIEGYLVEEEKDKPAIWNGKSVLTWQEIQKQKESYQIIICDFDQEEKKEYLEQRGFLYGVDYKIADEYFSDLDESVETLSSGREIYVWGTGNCAAILMEDGFLKDKVSGFIDNDRKKAGSVFYDRMTIDPKEMECGDWSDRFVIVAVDQYTPIKTQLQGYGGREHVDFIWYRKIIDRPSRLLQKTIYDTNQYHLVCDTMLNTYEIEATGDVACCCTTFLNERIGNLIHQDFEAIWESNLHKILCLSAVNQTFTFCKSDMCPVLMEKKKGKYKHTSIETEPYHQMEKKPKVMLISIDSSCNLYCESCRDRISTLKGEAYDDAQHMADKLLAADHFGDVEFIVMAGNGEVFLSKIYEQIWSNEQTKHVKRFRLLSNGTLFLPSKWEKFTEGRSSEVAVTFSIDAATQDTYRQVRRGGNFKQLMKNLTFASELRKKGELAYFQISFVVQRKNYKEMPLFVELGKKLGADKVFFTRILNWGTYHAEEFERIAMTDKEGHAKKELQEILNMPIMHDPIVDLGTIHSKSDEMEYDYIYNYYLWEIDRYLEKNH